MSRETLSQAYYAELAHSGRLEQAGVSALWIDAYWSRLGQAGLERLMHTARHPEQFWKALGNLHWL